MLQPFESVGSRAERPRRLRRSVLTVPGSSPSMLARAGGRGADEIMLDLEDAVAVDEKERARRIVIEALHTHDYGEAVVTVRVNDATTPFMYADVVDLVQQAGGRFDCLVIPKVDHPGHLWFVEHLLTQLETAHAPDIRHGCEVQIESGRGAVHLADIARVTDRTESIVFGPGDYAANIGVPHLHLGVSDPDHPGYQWVGITAHIVNVARSVEADAIDGPFSDIGDPDGFTRMAMLARLSGMDGKWCIHPSQVARANQVFTPSPEQLADALALLDAYRAAVADGRGAALHDGRMIDDASRRMAEKVVARGRAAGLTA